MGETAIRYRATSSFHVVGLLSMAVVIGLSTASSHSAGRFLPSVGLLLYPIWCSWIYWFRTSTQLVLQPRQLVAVRRGTSRIVDLDDLQAIRPMRSCRGLLIFEIEGQRPIRVAGLGGISRFTSEIVARRPEVRVRLGWDVRRLERAWAKRGILGLDEVPSSVERGSGWNEPLDA